MYTHTYVYGALTDGALTDGALMGLNQYFNLKTTF